MRYYLILKPIFFLAAFLLTRQVNGQSTILIGNTPVQVDTLITGLDVPWETTYHKGSIWTTERKGIVSRIDTATGIKKVLLRLSGTIIQQSESGLLGLALHPNFENQPEVFLAYTYLNSGFIKERIVKYRFENDSLINPEILLNNLPGNSTHNGCRLFFLSDTTLIASTGDVQNLSYPQDSSSLSGKILRMKTDGSVPPGNPFPGSLVLSLGHRNVQGITGMPDGKIVLSEHGASTDDEIQLLEPGRNYGWPNVEGFCSTPTEISFCNSHQVKEPLISYTPTIAPSDMVFYENPLFPEFNNCLLLTVLKNKELRAVRFISSNDSVLAETIYLKNRFGRLRDITVGANKEIYLATNGASWANTDPNTHSIIRLRPMPQITGTKTRKADESFLLAFPNPASSVFSLEIKGDIKLPARLEAFNSLGIKIMELPMETKSITLNTKQIGLPGIYSLCVFGNDGNVLRSGRFLIQ